LPNAINVNGAVSVANTQQSGEAADAKAATFQHSQLGAGTAKGLDASLFEEAAMNIASSRKIKTKDNKKDKESLQKLIEAHKKKVQDMPDAEKLDQCLQKLKEQLKSGNLTDENIKDAIGEYSGDSTHQYLGLEDLIAYLQESENEDDKQLASQLASYNKTFYEENTFDIQSGINVSGVAAKHIEESGEGTIGELRDVWRSTVSSALALPEFKTIAEMFSFVLEKAGDINKMGEWLQWTTRALGHELDLAQGEQCLDPTRMKFARSQLEGSFWLNTLYEQCAEIDSKLPGLIHDELQNG